eukprot:21570-Heterococcus_DN1.PRE.2
MSDSSGRYISKNLIAYNVRSTPQAYAQQIIASQRLKVHRGLNLLPAKVDEWCSSLFRAAHQAILGYNPISAQLGHVLVVDYTNAPASGGNFTSEQEDNC